MEYITVKEASGFWNMDISTIGKLLRAGKIPEASKIGGHWVIPKGTPKPLDGRTRIAKTDSRNNFFRFPLYVNGDEDSFHPPLSADEKALRQAQLDFFACDFKSAELKFIKFAKTSENIYFRQISLFFLCLLSAVYRGEENFTAYYTDLELSFTNDFPYKKEMELLSPLLLICLTLYKIAGERFHLDIDYDYSPTIYPIMTYISIGCEMTESTVPSATLYEFELMRLKKDGFVFEAQLLHIALFIFYYIKSDEKSAKHHLKSATDIAYKYNLIYPIADAYPYYKPIFNTVLKKYPQKFFDKIKSFSKQIDDSFSNFSKIHNISDMFYLLSSDEIKYVLFAYQGYSYNQVASIAHISKHTVANRYAQIYTKLGVNGKQGLIDKINNLMK